MTYQTVNLDTWERGSLFRFYIDRMRIVMSLTVDVDVTPLLAFARTRGMKFYPLMIWSVSKVVNAHAEFQYGWDDDGNLIRWDTVFPSYAEFHREDAAFTKLVTPYSDDPFRFHARFLEDRRRYRAARGIVPTPLRNTFDVSCLPWVRYRHFDVHVFDEGKFLAPVVTWGRYTEEGGRFTLPLTMNIHHAVADGFHLSRFFLELQEQLDTFPNP